MIRVFRVFRGSIFVFGLNDCDSPQLMGSSAMTRKKRRIAAVFDLKWPYKRHYSPFAGLQDYARQHADWIFDIGSYPELQLARGERFDGIIGRITPECAAAARKARIPVVNMWIESPVASKLPGVYPDFHEAGRMAAGHLIGRGFKRLAYFGFAQTVSAVRQHEGVREAVREYGYPVTRHLVSRYWDERPKDWLRFEDSILKAQGAWEGPLGVVCMTDELARAVATLCLRHGWAIPEQLAFIGTGNDTLICTAVDPTLSSVAMGYTTCGFEAARLLDHLMQGAKPPSAVTFCPPRELVLRRSSDVFAVSDPKVALALRHMAEHSSGPLAVAGIALAAGVGRKTLERRFQQHIGRTINDELIRIRIAKLKRLLVEGEENVAKLSDVAGFGNLVSMHMLFKRATGMTPRQYRERHGPRPARSDSGV